jgi:hypothetical protein
MGLRAWWQSRHLTRARAYLTRHPELTLRALRAAPDLGLAAVTAYWEQQLALSAAQLPDRKTAPWPILTQLGQGARQAVTQTLPKVSPFNLRRFSEYPPARKAINSLCQPLLELNWVIRRIPDPSGPDPEPTAAERRQIATATRVLTEPNADDSWRTFAEQVLEDLVVGGYGAIELVPHDDPERPVVLYPVDGQSIRLNANWAGDADEPRYSQALAYVGLSVGTHARVELRDDELIYLKLHARTHTPFGLGFLEVAFASVNAWLGAFEYAERRASNAVPNFGLFLGEHIGVDQVRQWRQYWQEQIEGYGQIPLVGGGPAPTLRRPDQTAGRNNAVSRTGPLYRPT